MDVHEQLITVKIEDIAFGGDGVGRLADGRIVFVPYTAVGDVARVRVVRQQRRHARGELEELLTPGPARVEPPCAYYGTCDGCRYQHIDAAAALSHKTQQLKEILQRIGGIADVPDVDPVVASPQPYGYRNKLKLRRSGKGYGYLAADNRTVVPIDRCEIADSAINEALAATRSTLRDETVTFRVDATGSVHHYGDTGTDALWLTEPLGDGNMMVPLTGFCQVNPAVGGQLVDWVRRQFAETPTTHLIDLYAGVGVFAIVLAPDAETVCAVESQAVAVAAAKANAEARGLQNITFVERRVDRNISEVFEGCDATATTIVLDPPRQGCGRGVIEKIAQFAPHRLIYVSCNAATLARDIGTLATAMALERLALFDMFPQTAHFESVAVFRALP
ncbi:MAG: class I SAM-dependent RNA methyltransferase [Lentisphaeria bacterium]